MFNIEDDLLLRMPVQPALQTGGEAEAQSSQASPVDAEEEEVNLAQLAQMVYVLLKRELQIERERRGI